VRDHRPTPRVQLVSVKAHPERPRDWHGRITRDLIVQNPHRASLATLGRHLDRIKKGTDKAQSEQSSADDKGNREDVPASRFVFPSSAFAFRPDSLMK
jgi:hypothetical protein